MVDVQPSGISELLARVWSDPCAGRNAAPVLSPCRPRGSRTLLPAPLGERPGSRRPHRSNDAIPHGRTSGMAPGTGATTMDNRVTDGSSGVAVGAGAGVGVGVGAAAGGGVGVVAGAGVGVIAGAVAGEGVAVGAISQASAKTAASKHRSPTRSGMGSGRAQVVEHVGREDHLSRPPSVGAAIVGASINWSLACWAGRGAMTLRPRRERNPTHANVHRISGPSFRSPSYRRSRRSAAAGDVPLAGLHGAQPPATAPPGRRSASSSGPRGSGVAGPYSRQPGPQGITRQPTVWSSQARRALSAHAWWGATDRSPDVENARTRT